MPGCFGRWARDFSVRFDRVPSADRAAAMSRQDCSACSFKRSSNVIPVSALAIAAILAGLVCRGKKSLSPGTGRAAAAFAALLCAACVFVLVQFCRADLFFRRGREAVAAAAPANPTYMGGLDDLRRAAELDPWALEYAVTRGDALLRAAAAASPEGGRPLIDEVLALSDDAVRRHSGNPDAHQLRPPRL